MKTPEELLQIWIQSCTDKIGTGMPFNPEKFIEYVQKDALSDSMTNTTDQQELEMARRIAMNERIRADQLHEELIKWIEKCNEIYRQLHTITKKEYKNALIAELKTLKQILQKNNQTQTN